jgi:hypothetical protein
MMAVIHEACCSPLKLMVLMRSQLKVCGDVKVKAVTNERCAGSTAKLTSRRSRSSRGIMSTGLCPNDAPAPRVSTVTYLSVVGTRAWAKNKK